MENFPYDNGPNCPSGGGGIALSLAVFTAGDKQGIANNFRSGCLNISIENESDAINLNRAYPITDLTGLTNKGYTFSIKNTCSTSTNFMINLESLNQTSNTLDTKYIKTSLSSDTMDNLIQKLDSGMITQHHLENAYLAHNLYVGTIAGDTSKTFNLRLWMDYDTTKEQGAEKTYTSKINVIANPALEVNSMAEIKTTFAKGNLNATIKENVATINYCISENNICTPNISTTITDNQISIPMPEDKERYFVCINVDEKNIVCSDLLLRTTLAYNFMKNSGITKPEIATITTVDNINIPIEAIKSWDASSNNTNEVKAWVTNSETEGQYNLYLGQEGGVVAPLNSSSLFSGVTNTGFINLKSIDLSNFDTSKVTNMMQMFLDTSSLTSLNLSNFNTSNVTNMQSMFNGASSLTNIDLSNFNTSNVTNMESMFRNASSLTNIDLSNFDTGKVKNMAHMFNRASSLTDLDLSSFNTSQVTNMSGMFINCSSLTNINLSSFNTSNVANMQSMFNGASSLKNIDLNNFDTSKVTNMKSMFSEASSLTDLNLSNFHTSNVTDMSLMFYNASGLTSLDLSNFDTSQVNNMGYMFYGLSGVTSLDLSHFDTSQVTDISWMFYNAKSVETIKFNKADFNQVSSYKYMFSITPKLKTIEVKDTDAQTFINARLSDASKTGVTVTINPIS